MNQKTMDGMSLGVIRGLILIDKDRLCRRWLSVMSHLLLYGGRMMLLFMEVNSKQEDTIWKNKPSLLIRDKSKMRIMCINAMDYNQVGKNSFVVNGSKRRERFDIYIDLTKFYDKKRECVAVDKLDVYCLKLYLLYKLLNANNSRCSNKNSKKNFFVYYSMEKNFVDYIANCSLSQIISLAKELVKGHKIHKLLELNNSTYFNRQLDIIAIPFAYGGPSVAEISPVAILYELNKNLIFESLKKIVLRQKFEESALDYLNRVERELNDKNLKIILGGNHLSMLPVYKEAGKRNLNIITLDAHRDYKNETEISHASFLNEIKNGVIIFGCRDDIKIKRPDNITIFKLEQKEAFKKYVRNLSGNIYLDIDVDVINPDEMYATYSKINGGISKNDIIKLITDIGIERIEILSISEYVYFMDRENECMKMIMDIVEMYFMEIIKSEITM